MGLVRWLYDKLFLSGVENRVLRHPVSHHFTGDDLVINGMPIKAGDFVSLSRRYALDSETLSHLFMLPNGSRARITAQKSRGLDESPPGIYFTSRHPYIEPPHRNTVGIYETAKKRGAFSSMAFSSTIFSSIPTRPSRQKDWER